MNEAIAKIADLFCQHCRAIQKVYDYPVKCLYNPLTEEGKYAWCASCLDMADSLIKASELKVLGDGQHLLPVLVTRKEMLAMPLEVRRAILSRQSIEFNISHPEYYRSDEELDERAMQDKGMME